MNKYFSLLSLLFACGGERVIEKQQNSAPTIMIGSHSPDAEILEGYAETFRASVSDDNNTFEELSVAWYVGERLVCDWETVSPAGESFCDITFDAEDANVIAEVRDPDGAGGRTELGLIIVPTDAPTAEILNPIQNTNLYSDQLVEFSGMVGDNEDPLEDLIVTWTSNLDGELVLDTTPESDGFISDYGYLSEGQHALELRVEDTSGKVTKEQIVVQVGAENQEPLCSIVTPTDLTAVEYGDSVIFRGTAEDANISNAELNVRWVSDKDGELGSSEITSSGEFSFATNSLSANDHVIGLIVEDEVGASCRDEIILFVSNAPAANIEQPLSGEVYSLNESIVFQGSTSDVEDASTEIEIQWNSSIDGDFSTGNANSQGIQQTVFSGLSAGLHTITMTATDSTGLIGSSVVTLQINTPPESPTIAFANTPTYSNQTLEAVVSNGLDADGDPVQNYYQWFKNGVLQSNTTASIPANDLAVDDVWTVRVTPNDGYTDGVPTEASITISNSAPTLSIPTITSSDGVGFYNNSTLTCTSTATDIDETVTPTYSWDINGTTALGSSVDLNLYNVSSGDSITCMVTVIDSQNSSATTQQSVSISNRAPDITNASIFPSNPTTQDSLLCSALVTDSDGNSTTQSYSWSISGTIVGNGSTLDLGSLSVLPNEQIECTITATDSAGSANSQTVTSATVNTAPSIDSLSLTPSNPTLQDTLSCLVSTSDIDESSLSVAFQFVNQTTGSIYTPTTASTTIATLDIATTDAGYEHTIACEVVVTDSFGAQDNDTSIVTIQNSAPTFNTQAYITPATGIEMGTTLTCAASATDPDDGIASLSYVWNANGSQVAIGSTWIANPTDSNVGDSITCTAIAIDFEGNPTTSTSNSSVINNTLPVVISATLDNGSPFTNDTVTVNTIASDANGDSVTLAYEWHVIDASNNGQDGIVYNGTGAQFSSLQGSFGFDKGDEVYVLVTPSDGIDTGITVESDHALVQNSSPSQPVIALTSTVNPPVEGLDDLTCTILTPSTDDDGDAITYTYNWYDPNGTNAQILANSTSMVDTFLGSNTTPGLWECEVIATDGSLTNTDTADIDVEADWPGEITFTNCGNTGPNGPSQTQCDSAYTGTNLDGLMVLNSGYQSIEIPSTGVYEITAAGAQGATGSFRSPGLGWTLSGEFALNEGDLLNIVVGQMGLVGIQNGGGGGGTFVWIDADGRNVNPLIAAGGGGGGGYNTANGIDASSSTSGQGHGACGSSGGSNGGAGSDVYGNGMDGGGWFNPGNFGNSTTFAGKTNISGGSFGGYGNGGNGWASSDNGGGGGGGYSGGGSGCDGGNGYGGGGGGSYSSGSNTTHIGTNSNHGYVIINKL